MLGLMCVLLSILFASKGIVLDLLPYLATLLAFKARFDIQNFLFCIVFLSWWTERTTLNLAIQLAYLLSLNFAQKSLSLDNALSRSLRLWLFWVCYEGASILFMMETDLYWNYRLILMTVLFFIFIYYLNQSVKEHVFMLE